jgi:hypothetical protein
MGQCASVGARKMVTFSSTHSLFCSTGVTLLFAMKSPTIQPLFQLKIRLDPESSAVFAQPTVHLLLEAQAQRAESEQRLLRIAHELRNRLGAITAAVEVLNIAHADGELALEAKAVIGRQTRLLAQMLRDIGAVPRGPAWDPAGVEQIVVDAALSWLASPRDSMPGVRADGVTMLESH